MGVIESLQGKRPGREKTRPLQDPACLAEIDFTFAYGVSTDFGAAVVAKFIENEGLQGRFRVMSGETVSVASQQLLVGIASGDVPLASIRKVGPPATELRPYISAQFAKDDALSPTQRQEATAFCEDVGRQLFASYLDGMQRASEAWKPWPPEKLASCGLGMNGLGMVHAFSHSVPKATLPLIWASGEVNWKNRRVAWRPLLPNA